MEFIIGRSYIFRGVVGNDNTWSSQMKVWGDGRPRKCIAKQGLRTVFEGVENDSRIPELTGWYYGHIDSFFVDATDKLAIVGDGVISITSEEDTVDYDLRSHKWLYGGKEYTFSSRAQHLFSGIRARNGFLSETTYTPNQRCVVTGKSTFISVYGLPISIEHIIDVTKCDKCGKGVLYTERKYDMCPECFAKEPKCEDCGCIHTTLLEVIGLNNLPRKVCGACRSSNYSRCSHCGRWEHDAHMNNDLCSTCYAVAPVCARCGSHGYDFHSYDGDSLCASCYRDALRVIQSYNYKPTPKFFGEGPRYFGFELEVDSSLGETQLSERAHAIQKMSKCFYLKHDGSLYSGFEIVTHPHSLATYEQDKELWKQVVEYASTHNLKSHDCDSCGLHIHISRKAFGTNETEQDRNISKLIFLYEKFYPQFLKFSRRRESQLHRYAKRYCETTPPSVEECMELAKSEFDRYFAINITPSQTVELRFFRGTLVLDTLFASLQLADRLVDVVIGHSSKEIASMEWADIVATDKQELSQYLVSRGL